MNTAYNTTNVQEDHNRYNELLQAALKRINDRKTDKTAQEPEEVTTTATEVTTTATQQPEPVATHENVTTEPTEASEPEQVTATAPSKTNKTRRTKTASPKPLGREIYHIFTKKNSRWEFGFDKSVYHAPEGYATLADNYMIITSNLDYKEEHSGKMIQEDGTESKSDPRQLIEILNWGATREDPHNVTAKEIEERIKATEDEEKRTALCELFDKDMTPEEVKEELKYNKEARAHANAKAKHQFTKLILPNCEPIYLNTDNMKKALKVAKRLATTCVSHFKNLLQFTGEAGSIMLAMVQGITGENEISKNPLIVDLTDATPAPEDTTIEEATPATAPQATEEDTTIAPEDVTTEEATAPEVVTTATDDATVLSHAIEEYGNLGAKYLNTLDYTQATEQVYSTKRGNSAKVTERYYTIDRRTIYGLYRRYNRNGKRAEFAVYKDEQIIEKRTYGKNNNTYKAEVMYCGGTLCYQVEEGKVTSAEYYEGKRRDYHIEFDDTNRPETPRDLPAPTPSKPTSKETTKEEQPTSKTATAPTTEEVTEPEEVQEVTTSKQENGTPYWLLLDNELRAQQEEQEQETPPATPEKSEEEPMHAPQMLKKMIEEHYKRIKDGTATESIYNADALQTEVLTPKRAKELLGDDASDYKTYILVDGKHLVETNRPTLKKTLYIDDESKEYKEYLRGNISKVELYRDDMMSMYGSKGKIKDVEENPATLTVDETKDKVLSFNLYRRADYGYRKANPDEVAIYKAAMRANHEAFSKRLDSYLKRYGKKIYVSAYWANR